MKRSQTILACLLTGLFAAALPIALTGCGEGEWADPPTEAEPAAVLTFNVKGMHCMGCVGSVRNAIAKLDGVQSCEVSLDEATAIVSVMDPALESKILEAVSELEFTIEPIAN